MSIATIGDNLIHYEVLGRGEPIIFVHGWVGSWRYWWPSMQALSARHRTFAFDLWGYGDSSKATDKYTFDAYVDMLGQFIEKLGIVQPVTLVGHSLGAAVALRFTNKRPDQVKRIAAIALPVTGSTIHERLANWDSATVLSRILGTNHPEVELELRKTDTAAMNSLARELTNYNFLADIKACPKPLMIIFGSQDPLIRQPTNSLPDESGDRAYIALESCNHFPMLEQAVKFNRLVLDFTHSDGDLQNIAPKEHWQRRNR